MCKICVELFPTAFLLPLDCLLMPQINCQKPTQIHREWVSATPPPPSPFGSRQSMLCSCCRCQLLMIIPSPAVAICGAFPGKADPQQHATVQFMEITTRRRQKINNSEEEKRKKKMEKKEMETRANEPQQ